MKFLNFCVLVIETNKPPWWSSQLTKAIKEKQNLYSQCKFTRSPLDYAKYVSKRNNVKFSIRSAKVKHDESLIQKFKSNPKALYGYVRNRSKVRSKISQLEKNNGTLTVNDKETVEVLNTYFKSAFTVEDIYNMPDFPT